MTAPDEIWIDYAAANKKDIAYDSPPLTAYSDCRDAYTRSDLIPAMIRQAVDAERERCAEQIIDMAKDEAALSKKYRGGSNPWFAHVQKAKMYEDCAAAIRGTKP